MTEKRVVVIAGNFMFPDKNAAGKRVLGMGYILSDTGYDVCFIGCDAERTGEDILDTKRVWNGFTSYSFFGGRSIKDILSYQRAFEEFKTIIECIGLGKIDLVILYGSPTLAVWVFIVQRFLKKKRIPVVFDCVDWIEKTESTAFVVNAVKYLDTAYMKRILAVRCDGVIAISNYLRSYYQDRGCETLLLPPVGKFYGNDHRLENSKDIRFIYAGAITKLRPVEWGIQKDRIDKSIEIISEVCEDCPNIKFEIYGITRDEYISAKPEHENIIDDNLSEKVTFHGRVMNEVVCAALKRSDIMILNRDVNKVTTAGFPSKVAESLCFGVPVLTNNTSDIAMYIEHGRNGWIISADIKKAISEVKEICKNVDNIVTVKEECKTECAFDYRKYTYDMEAFIKRILEKKKRENNVQQENLL